MPPAYSVVSEFEGRCDGNVWCSGRCEKGGLSMARCEAQRSLGRFRAGVWPVVQTALAATLAWSAAALILGHEQPFVAAIAAGGFLMGGGGADTQPGARAGPRGAPG